MSLDNEQLARLASLARLEIDPAESERLRTEMEKMVELAGKVTAAATDSSPPIAHVQQGDQPLRPDDPQPVTDNLSRLAAEADADMVVVPRVVE
ncbi:MAG: aspartyl/glutamyl-tRNA amidotransferase subunit C [Betaproteobacteria bacterium]|nr:aspartyl/glutamyl-tRNA amidotransferase subunit C [Betaproteobacteria bacterium]